MIFRLLARATAILTGRTSRSAGKIGDDEVRIEAVRSGLDAGDDALDMIPAGSTVVEFLEPTELFRLDGRTPCRRTAVFCSSPAICLRNVEIGATPRM